MRRILLSTVAVTFLSSYIFAATGELKITWDDETRSNKLEWTLPQVTLSAGTYMWHSVDLYRTFGYSQGVDSWTLVASGVTDGEFLDYTDYGSYSYEIRNIVQWNYDSTADSWTDSQSEGKSFPTYGPVISYFISDADNNRVVDIADDAGGQSTFGGRWKFTYNLQKAGYIDVRIYKPGTKFKYDSEGFYERPSSTWCVKKIIAYSDVNSAARPAGENYEEWDCTNSSGNIVGNGIYYVMFEVFDPFDPPESYEVGISSRYYNYNGNGKYKKRDAYVGVIPVDILRVKDLSVTGISQSNTTSSIKYNINNSAEVTVVILNTGAEFKIADSSGSISYGSGDTYSYKSGALIPASTGTQAGSDLVTVITYYRSEGDNTESWDGTSASGGAVDNGIYPVGVCARDASDNSAVSTDGNDQPFYDFITVDKRTTSSSVEGDAPTLASITPSSGTTVASVSVITVNLTDASGVNAAATTISLTSGTITYSNGSGAVQSPTSGSNTSTSFTLTLSSPITSAGSYTITVVATDIYNNQQTYTSKFSISSSGSSAAAGFESVVCAYPQPCKTGSITFKYDNVSSSLFAGASTSIKLDVYTIYGEKVKTYSATSSAGTFPWNYSALNLAPGVYVYRITASGNSKNVSAVKKMVIYK